MSQFGYKDAVECCGESFGKGKTDGIHHFSVIHSPRNLILKGNQGGQKHFILGKSIQPFLSHHLLIRGPRKIFKENLIYDFHRDQNETGRLVVKHQKNQNSSALLGI